MRVKVFGPIAGYAPHPSGGRQMTSFGPDEVIEVDDDDDDAVAFWRRWAEGGTAEILDETPAPTEPVTATVDSAELDLSGAEPSPAGPSAPAELDEVPTTATGPDGVIAWIAQADTPDERLRRADLAERAEDARGDDYRVTVRAAIDRARETERE